MQMQWDSAPATASASREEPRRGDMLVARAEVATQSDEAPGSWRCVDGAPQESCIRGTPHIGAQGRNDGPGYNRRKPLFCLMMNLIFTILLDPLPDFCYATKSCTCSERLRAALCRTSTRKAWPLHRGA